MNRNFPTVEEVLAIHENLINETGGASGLRDLGALESALMRPQIGYYDDHIDEAAALLESLAINHPFVDGNKRIALATADIFLRMNGYYIDCDSPTAYDHFMRLFDTNSFRFDQLRTWLAEHVAQLPTD